MQTNILGVYKYITEMSITSMSTNETPERETYWLVRRKDDDAFELQQLNDHNLPSGPRKILAKKDLITNYCPELDYYEKNTLPVMKSLREKLDKGWEKLEEGNLDDAERQFLKALLLDENNAEANTGLGTVYCEKKDFDKVRKILDVLLNNDATFMQEQRNNFNGFGISLRRQKLYPEALRFFSKALEVDALDEHLHFNIARVYYDMGATDQCFSCLDTALDLNPDFIEAQRFKQFMTAAIKPKNLGSNDSPTSQEQDGK